MTLGEKIKIARKQAGLSQEQLAEKMGVSRSAVAKWEVNNGMPDIDNLKILSRILGVTIDYLVNDGDKLDNIKTEEAVDIRKDTVNTPNDCTVNECESLYAAASKGDTASSKHKDGKENKKLLIVSIITVMICAVGIVGVFMFNKATYKDMKTYTVASDIHSLHLEINAADITVKQGEEFFVESNLKNLTVNDENGILLIRDAKRHFKNYNDAVLIITIPKDAQFHNAELKIGAGKLSVDTLSAKVLDCDFGAGEVRIDSLSASSSAKLYSGAGKVTVSGGDINNLDVNMGAGKLDISSFLTGKCDFGFGVGEANIILLGSKDDYTLSINSGLGSISVDGNSILGHLQHGNGQTELQLNGGVGAVNVRFKDTENY